MFKLLIDKTKSKLMKKKICIVSEDETVIGWAETLSILSDFKNMGLDRQAFVEIVGSKDPEYRDYKKVQQLWAFWQMRLRNDHVNRDLAKVLEQLKSE